MGTQDPHPSRRFHRGLTARLMIAMVLVAVTVVLLDTALTRWAFQARFLSYVNEQERSAVANLAERLADLHAETGDWRALENRRDLARLLNQSLREDLHDQLRERELHTITTDHGHSEIQPDPDRSRRFRATRMLMPRMHLLDPDDGVVVGARESLPTGSRVHRTDVVVNGEVVGRIAIAPLHALAQESDRRFAAEHTRTMWWIAALAIALACLAGLALARYMLAPVRAIATGARELAQGHYDARLDDSRGDELGALARDFNVLAAGLESSRESRRRWLADIAHELRTPLAVLRAEIEALRDGIRPLDYAAMHALADEAERLGRLVDDLHELSLADAGALSYHFADIEPVKLVQSAADRYRGRLEQAGLQLELHLPAAVPAVLGDADRLGQLLANLLENSLRYTDPPGPVVLSVAQEGAWILIQVDDGPPGVPEAEIPAMFERFGRREAARDRASGGTGLGLAIARNIAEAHGGALSATPSTFRGLRLSLRLPVARSEAAK